MFSGKFGNVSGVGERFDEFWGGGASTVRARSLRWSPAGHPGGLRREAEKHVRGAVVHADCGGSRGVVHEIPHLPLACELTKDEIYDEEHRNASASRPLTQNPKCMQLITTNPPHSRTHKAYSRVDITGVVRTEVNN